MSRSRQHRGPHRHHDINDRTRNKSSQTYDTDDPLSEELRASIRNMVNNISESFIVTWYTMISQSNHDFVASCEQLIENAMTKFAELCVTKLDPYKTGRLVAGLLHDHVLNEDSSEKLRSIECQIDDHEYDICQSVVVRLFGLISDEELRRVIFTPYPELQSRSDQTNRSRREVNESYAGSSTSALYTLVIAMLTKATFMPIIDTISSPKWLFAVIIWLCQKEERELAKRKTAKNFNEQHKDPTNPNSCNNILSNEVPTTSHIAPSIPATSIIITAPSIRSLDLEDGINLANSINFPTPVSESLIRPIDNIEIFATEEVKSNNSCYVLYCIGFGGLCHRHPSAGSNFMLPEAAVDLSLIDKRGSRYTRTLDSNEPRKFTTSTTASTSNQCPDTSYRKSYRRKMTIKRRFREFVILQLRLEENPKIRPYMKNIPKPTKLKAATQNIFSLPGITNIKLDQSTIKLRQNFLERFLLALNNCPFIANSYEFKEFFSYNMSPNPTQISKSKSLILQVNLNKVFVGSVKGAFSMLEALLPGEDNRLRSSPDHDPDAWLTELQQSTMKLHIQTRTSHSKMPLERFLDSKLSSMSDMLSRHDKSSSLGRYSERSGSVHFGNSRGGSLKAHMVKSYSVGSSGSSPTFMSRSSSSTSRHTGETSRSSSTESVYYDAPNDLGSSDNDLANSIQICDSAPIASKLIDIFHYSLSGNSNCTNSSLSFCARFMLGKSIERRVAELLSLLNVKVATFCMNAITDAIWGESEDPPLDLENSSLDEAVKHLTKLLENSSTLPYIPRPLLHSFISKQSRFYLSQLSNQKRNKFVIYSFFVNLLDELEPVDQ